MAARGHDVRVVCARDWDTGPAYWNGVTEDRGSPVPVDGINLNWTRASDPNRVLFDSDEVERWFEQSVRRMEPDVVHVTSLITLGLGVIRAADRAGVPQVLTLTDFWLTCPRTTLLRGDGTLCDGNASADECLRCLLTGSRLDQRVRPWMPVAWRTALWRGVSRIPWLAGVRGARGMALDVVRRQAAVRDALGLPDAVLSPSRFVQETFSRVGLAECIRLVRHGHDLSWLRHAPARQASPALRVAYLGQLTPIKGVHIAVEGFRRAAADSEARFDIWGDPSMDPAYVSSLRTLIGSARNIVLRGRYGRDQLGEVLASADVVLVPSLWYENAPLVIQEAFAAKVPVIATDLGGMAESVRHGVDGLLFQRGDAADLARQLRRLLDEPDLRSRLAAGIPEVRTTSDELDELEGIYREMVARKSVADDSPNGHRRRTPAGGA
jgi:glycosyltransferase involved in cell wall biosynthesis